MRLTTWTPGKDNSIGKGMPPIDDFGNLERPNRPLALSLDVGVKPQQGRGATYLIESYPQTKTKYNRINVHTNK